MPPHCWTPAVVQDHLHDEELSSFVLLGFAVLQLVPIALHPTTLGRVCLCLLQILLTAARCLLCLLF